jgi:rfaE bifunctional protein kinase chain/domain
MSQDLDKIFAQFSTQNVLVIGDVMVDSYLRGKVERISPEAPVPVINILKHENRLGGSANVALNLLGLKAHPIICSVIGNDRMGEEFIELMKSKGLSVDGIIKSTNRITTVKTRIISQHQQMLRMDEEQTNDLNSDDEKLLLDAIKKILDSQKIAVVIFEDYNKGVITQRIIEIPLPFAMRKTFPLVLTLRKIIFLILRTSLCLNLILRNYVKV